MGGTPTPTRLSKLPDQFGKYSLLGHLATGGMAEVYLARAGGIEGFEKIVVIKRIRPEITDDLMTSHFLDEARLVATLEHPNIAQVYEIGLVNDSYFFVMEYVHGADLRQVLDTSLRKQRAISLADAVYIMIHVCTALHYAHEKQNRDGSPLGIIHRDVSPSNVLLSHDGAIKVCDFGVAKATSRGVDTDRGVLKGKFSYMSPEQCQSKQIDCRSDVFAIGILLYELSTQSRLFEAANDFELLRKIVEDPIPLPSDRVPDYPPELEQIVMKALAQLPEDRYSTAQAMQLDLEAFARERMLPLSSVNIAKLMASLFEKRTAAWSRAMRAGTALGDHLLDTAVRNSKGLLPVFIPLGAGEGEVDHALEAGDTELAAQTPLPRRSEPKLARGLRQSEPMAAVRAGPSALWIVLALVGGLAAAGATLASMLLTRADRKAAVSQLETDAERIVTNIESTLRTATLRVDAIATTPMLRAAIGTDASTIMDLANGEMVFSARPGEVLEVFQIRGSEPVSMIRIPATAKPLEVLTTRQSKLLASGDELVIVTSAPITDYKTRIGGAVVIAVPVELAAARRYLGDSTSATLLGLEHEVRLVRASPEEPGGLVLSIPIASDPAWGEKQLTLRVAAPQIAAPSWRRPTQIAGGAFAVTMILIYASRLRRRRADA